MMSRKDTQLGRVEGVRDVLERLKKRICGTISFLSFALNSYHRGRIGKYSNFKTPTAQTGPLSSMLEMRFLESVPYETPLLGWSYP